MWLSINICLMHSIVVLNGKENIQYTIIFQRFCRMHRPSSLYRERIFKVKKMPELFFPKYVSEIHKNDFLFPPHRQNQNTVPYHRLLCLFWIKLVILIRGSLAGEVSRGKKRKQNSHFHTYISMAEPTNYAYRLL